MGSLSFIVVVLALMGLAGIVSYIAFSRRKEISIRRVLGASIANVLFLFNREFIILVALSTLIAAPIVIYFSNLWLNSFAYQIEPNVGVVLIAGLVTLLLVSAVVSLRVSRINYDKME